MSTPGVPDVEELRVENAAMHKQMEDLNKQMDRMLLKRDKPGARSKLVSRDDRPVELRQLAAKNEQLRKERLKWWAEVTHSDTAVRISDTRNEISAVELEIQQMQEDIRGLENIRKNQSHVVEVAKHADEELKFLHQEHRAEIQEFREELRTLAEENKHSEKTLAQWQARFHGAQEKLKLGMTAEEIEALRTKVDEQGARIETLKGELEERNVSARGKREEGHKEIDAFNREKDKLQRTKEALKHLLVERERELKLSYARNKLRGSGAIES